MRIESSDGKSANLERSAESIAFNTRFKRAFRASWFGLLLALCSLPIPGLHFFLVPLFLIIALVAAIRRFADTERVDMSNVNCPACNQILDEQFIYLSGGQSRLFCYKCRSNLWIA